MQWFDQNVCFNWLVVTSSHKSRHTKSKWKWKYTMRTLKQVCDYKVNQRLGPVLKNHLGKQNTQWQWTEMLKIMMQIGKRLTMALNQINATNVTMHSLKQAIWGNIWKRTLGKSQTNAKKCDFASSHAGSLKTHLKTHSEEKLNKCNQCDYASLYASALRTHLKIHNGEKSNKCNKCDYAVCILSGWPFEDTGTLRRHLKTHSGEKSNKCNQCTMRFRQWRIGIRVFGTFALILWPSKYFR